jgi:hypothetical protein
MRFDKRQHIRRPIQIAAKMATYNDAPLRDCMVLDISESGARLGIEAAVVPPDEFTIVFASGGRPYRRCRVLWRGETQLGVLFDRENSSHTYPESLPFSRC